MGQMFYRRILALQLALAIGGESLLAQAKGLQELSPPESKSGEQSPAAAPSSAEDSPTEAEASEAGAKTASSHLQFLQGKLELATSYGFVRLRKAGQDWRAAGMSDLEASYRLGLELSFADLFATARYAPIDVAPSFKKNGRREEYKGVLEHYLLGAKLRFPTKKSNLFAVASSEVGMSLTHLKDQIGLVDDSAPHQPGFAITAGGGLDWLPLDGLAFGPRLRLGFGSSSFFQLSAHTTFAF